MSIDILKKIRKDESGATAIEYALIAVLVSVVAFGALTALGESQNMTYQTVSKELTAEGDSGPDNNNAGGPGGGKAGGGLSGGGGLSSNSGKAGGGLSGGGGLSSNSGKGGGLSGGGKGGGKAGGDDGKLLAKGGCYGKSNPC